MTVSSGAARRQVVPRWRSWRTTGLLGELAGSGARRELPDSSLYVERLLRDYEADPSVGMAGDLLNAAIVLGSDDPRVVEVAKDVVQHSDRSALRAIGQAIIEGDGDSQSAIFQVGETNSARRVHRLREILRREPRNTVRWVHIAREFLALGQTVKAEEAMRIALALSPHNRFVLRSASALYVQTSDLDRALALLAQSPLAGVDPWLLAPQIAISDLAGVKQKFARLGREALEGDFPAMHVTELAAALGTVEIAAGSARRGRQLLRRSADEANENALAQVEWCGQETKQMIVDDLPEDVPRAFEANARRASSEAKWLEGVKLAEFWCLDQPFQSEAKVFASYCACEGEQWRTASEFTTAGLKIDPRNGTLLNNHAFALIELGELRTAVESLVKPRGTVSEDHGVVRSATEALLLFRVGAPALGRRRYAAGNYGIWSFARKESPSEGSPDVDT